MSPIQPQTMFHGQRKEARSELQGLLDFKRLPARLNTIQTALVLGFQEHDIAPLVASKLLQPLGKPASNAPKYFAAVDVEVLALDRDWLSRATKTLALYWQRKNLKKRGPGVHVGSCQTDDAAA